VPRDPDRNATRTVDQNVPLAPMTTLELGGPARFFVEANDVETAIGGLRWAAAHGVPAFVLGGGSNLVVADAGFDGLVIRMRARGVTFASPNSGGEVLVEAQAGEPWDALVEETVARNLAGLECLSGIPGLAGATPIQNVGAYGQEVSDTIHSVRAIDRGTLEMIDLPPTACAFGYRDSLFRRQPERYVVASVTFALRPGGAPPIRYPELAAALAATSSPAPSLAAVREAVLRLRRSKSMVIDAADPNRRSVGSFFTNPIVPRATATDLCDRLLRDGVIAAAAELPQFPAGADAVKLSAGWLIERAGIAKGLRAGAVGVSSQHALALVHHGGGTSAALVALAARVRRAVFDRFGIALSPEPIFLGAISVDSLT
jgi:UDP-N-acetylmuramate dehydrogenase